MKNPFMLRSAHEAEVKAIRQAHRDTVNIITARHANEKADFQAEIKRLNDLLSKTLEPLALEPTDDQAKLVKSLEEELATIDQTIKLTEDERVVVMKGRRRKTRELTGLIKLRTEVADKLAKAKAPQVDAAA